MTGLIARIAVAALALSAGMAHAADVATESGTPGTLVNVRLVDKDHAGLDLSKNLGLGIGMKGDMTAAKFAVEADKFAVRQGLVTFKVTNTSTDMAHEMLVVPISAMDTPLAYNDNENRYDEEKVEDLGEVEELAPGKSGELTLELKPGLYALICNIPGHYAAGMWRVIAVQ